MTPKRTRPIPCPNAKVVFIDGTMIVLNFRVKPERIEGRKHKHTHTLPNV